MSNASAEVAADFRDALQDLKQNSRPEISNLTIIAKENTEHAQAISRELEEHIKTTQPVYKLPALYVLDSIVKNVGTPYTVYLSRNLYNTFMDAYLVMDPGNRRAMDGLLKTWKQPVPESMDIRPVFPAEVTRDIENTLIKIRTATVQQQAQAQRLPHGLPPKPATNPMANPQWRNTPTPPQNTPRYPAPNDPRLRHFQPNSQYGPVPSATPPAPVPSAQPFPPSAPSTPVSSGDLESLKADLAKLIAFTNTVSTVNPSDAASQQKLKALNDLQLILNTQAVPPQQLQAIRAQVQALQPPAPMPAFPPHAPVSVAPQPFVLPPQQAATPTMPPFNLAQLLANARSPVPPTPQSSIPVNPNSTQSLAEMLRRITTPVPQSSTPTPATPVYAPPPAFPPIPQPATAPPAVPAPVLPPTNNLAQLLAGLGKPPAVAASTPQPPADPPLPPSHQGAPTAAPPMDFLANLLKGLPSLPPLPPMPGAGQPIAAVLAPMGQQHPGARPAFGMVELTTAAMKQPRFHLVENLYGAKPNACATCGRRFDNTPEGREKKARHMDWHFKVKDPDAQKRGVHRSWYISEREWIDYREVDENSLFAQGSGGGKGATGAGAAKIDPKEKYVRVPAEPSLHGPCPICQENFEQSWNKEANDFVWKDAVSVGGKIYHATCWEEYSRVGGAGIAGPSTPDSVLGKRKAEMGESLNEKKVRAC